MKNKKFLKALATLTVGAVAAVSCLGFVACGDGDGDAHQHNYTWTANTDGTTHNGHCDVEGCDAPDVTNEAHVYDNDNDATCNKCGATREIGGGTTEKVDHTLTYSFAAVPEPADAADKTVLTQASFTGDNAFVKVANEGVTYRYDKPTDPTKKAPLCIEIKGEALKVTFQGTGKITISWGSTSSSNTSGLALVKADGSYVEASSLGTGVTKLAAADEKQNPAGLLTIYGGSNLKTAVTTEFTITEAGTYTIYSNFNYFSDKNQKDESRGCRIWGITMVDNY